MTFNGEPTAPRLSLEISHRNANDWCPMLGNGALNEFFLKERVRATKGNIAAGGLPDPSTTSKIFVHANVSCHEQLSDFMRENKQQIMEST